MWDFLIPESRNFAVFFGIPLDLMIPDKIPWDSPHSDSAISYFADFKALISRDVSHACCEYKENHCLHVPLLHFKARINVKRWKSGIFENKKETSPVTCCGGATHNSYKNTQVAIHDPENTQIHTQAIGWMPKMHRNIRRDSENLLSRTHYKLGRT